MGQASGFSKLAILGPRPVEAVRKLQFWGMLAHLIYKAKTHPSRFLWFAGFVVALGVAVALLLVWFDPDSIAIDL